MIAANTLPPPRLLRCSSLISFFSIKTPPFPPNRHHLRAIPLPSHFHSHPVKTLSMTNIIPSSHHPHHNNHHAHHLSSSSAAAASRPPTYQTPTETTTAKSKKKARRESPEGLLRHSLDMCSKRGDLLEALRLYDDDRSKGIPLSQHHYNVLLYLCSSPKSSDDGGDEADAVEIGLKRGFEIFRQMGADEIAPNEATFTSVARLAAAKEDPELAFDLVKKMAAHGIPPRLRSYGPALFGFCKKGMAKEAYEVDAHMEASGVLAEELELAALLKLSSDVGREERVYQLLHRLRASVRRVSETTAEIAEGWFGSDAAAEVGVEQWDVKKIKEGVVKAGGGWHGQGWLGKGKWQIARSRTDENGTCNYCGERLVCIDIDPLETENFASSLSSLACEREVKADFTSFQVQLSPQLFSFISPLIPSSTCWSVDISKCNI